MASRGITLPSITLSVWPRESLETEVPEGTLIQKPTGSSTWYDTPVRVNIVPAGTVVSPDAVSRTVEGAPGWIVKLYTFSMSVFRPCATRVYVPVGSPLVSKLYVKAP